MLYKSENEKYGYKQQHEWITKYRVEMSCPRKQYRVVKTNFFIKLITK